MLFYATQVIVGEDGETVETVPLLPPWAAVMEYVVKTAIGHDNTSVLLL